MTHVEIWIGTTRLVLVFETELLANDFLSDVFYDRSIMRQVTSNMGQTWRVRPSSVDLYRVLPQ